MKKKLKAIVRDDEQEFEEGLKITLEAFELINKEVKLYFEKKRLEVTPPPRIKVPDRLTISYPSTNHKKTRKKIDSGILLTESA